MKFTQNINLASGAAACIAAALALCGSSGLSYGQVVWARNGAPVETMITGGPWTLEQSGAANGLKSSGYCDSNGNQIGNPGTMRMQPYYFPTVIGLGAKISRAISIGVRRTPTKP